MRIASAPLLQLTPLGMMPVQALHSSMITYMPGTLNVNTRGTLLRH